MSGMDDVLLRTKLKPCTHITLLGTQEIKAARSTNVELTILPGQQSKLLTRSWLMTFYSLSTFFS